MNTTIEKSLQRLHWRFSQQNSFKPNETDVESLNFIIQWVKSQQSENAKEQQLFAKFFTYFFTKELESTQNIELAIKNTNLLCATPLSEFTKKLHFRINVLKYWMYLEEKGIPYIQEKYPTKEDVELIEDHIKNDKKYLNYWPLEKVETSITGQITDAIHNYKHLL